MFKNLLLTLLKKGVYALAAVFLLWLTQSLTNFHPTDPTQKALWEWLLLPLLTGLVAVVKRLLTWNPEK